MAESLVEDAFIWIIEVLDDRGSDNRGSKELTLQCEENFLGLAGESTKSVETSKQARDVHQSVTTSFT